MLSLLRVATRSNERSLLRRRFSRCVPQWTVWSVRLFRKPSSQSSKMGVEIETTAPGDGMTFPKPGQTVTVHYTGTLTNGTQFDCSRQRKQPFKFTIGKGDVIKGWEQGLAQMSVGQRAYLTCSPDFAYGSRGHPGIIPPNATLIFDVELLSVD